MNMETLLERLDQTLMENSLGEWLVAGLAALLVYFALIGIKRLAIRRSRKLEEQQDATVTPTEGIRWRRSILGAISGTTKLFILAVSASAGAYLLTLPAGLLDAIHSAAIILLFMQSAIWLTRIITVAVEIYAAEKAQEDDTVSNALSLIQLFARLAIWGVALLLILDNLGFDITALVAGLGIGGIAIALAAQNILGDLFASLSIVLDKPFVRGDYIVFGDIMGTVEKIGLKTTRLRSLSGEQIVCANTDLLNSRIRNYKRMWERRIIFGLGVVYQTPPEKLEQIPGLIKEAIEAQDLTRFDRAHFKTYGASSLDFEVVYWVKSPEFITYMDIQQAINMALFRRFSELEIEFAYPTQTLYINREGEEDGDGESDRAPRIG